jgi:hypothetical protein
MKCHKNKCRFIKNNNKIIDVEKGVLVGTRAFFHKSFISPSSSSLSFSLPLSVNSVLPDELILEIFRNLDSKSSRDACSLVCRRWLTLERFSRDTIRIGASGSLDALVDLLARRFPNVTNVYIDERLSVSLPVDFVSFISLFLICFLGHNLYVRSNY